VPAVARAGDRALLERYRPVYVHDARDRYPVAGVRDRTFPDPNDEAGGRGRMLRPRLVVITARDPRWMRSPGRWGSSRAAWPFESSSPRGPAFQGVRWDDPGAFAAGARGCMAGRCDERGECDGRELALSGAVAAALGLLVLLGVRRRRRAA
jgi:hypothetical protein